MERKYTTQEQSSYITCVSVCARECVYVCVGVHTHTHTHIHIITNYYTISISITIIGVVTISIIHSFDCHTHYD